MKSRSERTTSRLAPLLKWAGAKNWCADAFAPIFRTYLESGGYYIEPFVGSGSMHLATQAPLAVLGDTLEPLMEMHAVVRDTPGEFAWGLSGLCVRGVDEETYYWVRDESPRDTAVQRAARLLYLNRLDFNGLYRENKKGEFNVPYGGACYRKSIIGRSARDAIGALFPNREKIEHVSLALKTAELYTGDFAALVENASAGDLIYADPPYSGTFAQYAAGGFDDADQERLAVALAEAHFRGAVVVAHNALTDHVKYLYGEWCHMIYVNERRAIAADGDKRGDAPCVVAVSQNAPEGMAEVVRAALGERVMS